MVVDYGQYILPLAVAKRTAPNQGDLIRFAGTSFYINSKGFIATCSHIVESLGEGEFLIAKELRTNTFIEVKNLICHNKYDFAVGQIDVMNNQFFRPGDKTLLLGDDVDALSFTFYGKIGLDVRIDSRMLRGYVSRISQSPQNELKGKSTFEVSFPSLSGFSGAPITTHTGSFLAGILYNNIESSIEVYSFSEVEENKEKYSEKVCRILEFGAAHSIDDIKSFLDDLDVNAFV